MWFVLGFLLGALALWLWQRRACSAGQFVLLALGIGILLLTLQNYIGFGVELETQAQIFLLYAMAIPGLLFLALALAWPRILRKIKQRKA